jgi:hypothetical protein
VGDETDYQEGRKEDQGERSSRQGFGETCLPTVRPDVL